MKLPTIKARTTQLTWLQVICLAVSGLFYVSSNMTGAMLFLILGTLFGVTGAIRKYMDAKREYPEMFKKRARNPRRRR